LQEVQCAKSTLRKLSSIVRVREPGAKSTFEIVRKSIIINSKEVARSQRFSKIHVTRPVAI